ncbi:YdaS family helix-turn-helix protein [Sphingomonas aurantiaca]|uniref:transcriptional regulator n=1 Tax=Sphingomonas aurantiaca TaxID=185949 RepID=UPI002FE3A321
MLLVADMALEHESDSALALAVRAAGSQSAFGRLVDKRQSTVREWLKADRLPGEYVLRIEAATGISKERLRPDLYRAESPPVHGPQTAGDMGPAQ